MKNLLYDEELEECFNEFSHGNCSHGTWRRNETQADEVRNFNLNYLNTYRSFF